MKQILKRIDGTIIEESETLTFKELVIKNKANLRGAYLRGADLCGANLSSLQIARLQIVPQTGSFIGYKKLLDNSICKLLITEDAKRSNAPNSRKCRASKAIILEGNGCSKHDHSFLYKEGETIEVEDFDEQWWVECSTGIHFFLSKEEALVY